MQKIYLKHGNVVEFRNGDKLLFCWDLKKDKLIYLKGHGYETLDYYNEDLTYANDFKQMDIMKVYKDYTCQEVLWERKEEKPKPQLNEDEKAILKVLLNEKYKWIARDDDEMLVVFERKPHKAKWGCSQWACDEGSSIMVYMEIFSNLFQFIKWEDEEPYLIEDLLKGEEK